MVCRALSHVVATPYRQSYTRHGFCPTDSSALCHARPEFDALGHVLTRVRNSRSFGDVKPVRSIDSRNIEALRRWPRGCGAQSRKFLQMAQPFARAATPLRRALEAML